MSNTLHAAAAESGGTRNAPVLYVVAGESSGDHHAAAVLRELRRLQPDVLLVGRGGPELSALSDGRIRNWSDEAAVVGLWEVIKKYGYFRREFRATIDEIGVYRQLTVFLVDYPGFNLRLARALRRRDMRGQIVYYISPQVWAWNRGRIGKIAKLVDVMLCIFPFEKQLYENVKNSTMVTEFVGHPMIDALASDRVPESRRADLVALLPGSRRREVRKIFPPMLEAAQILRRERPQLKFAAAAASALRCDEMRAVRDAAGWTEDECPIEVGTAHHLMQSSSAGMVASGTATVEAAYFGLPHLIAYRVAPLTYVVGRAVIRVAHLGMINVLADREVVREYLQGECTAEKLAAETRRLLDDAGYRAAQVNALAEVIATLGPGGAARRAAEDLAMYLC